MTIHLPASSRDVYPKIVTQSSCNHAIMLSCYSEDSFQIPAVIPPFYWIIMEEEHPALIWVIHIGKALGKQLPTPRDPPSSSSFLAHSSCLMSYATRVITTATEMKACNHISSMIFLPITPCTSAMLTLTPINRVKMIKIREHADLNQEDPISLVTDSSLSRDIAKQKRLLCCGPYKSLSL